MSTRTLILLFFLFSADFILAQDNSFWRVIDEKDIDIDEPHLIKASKETFYKLETKQLKSVLIDSEKDRKRSDLITIPLPDGRFENFSISRNRLLPESLLLKYPGISTYSGRSVENKNRKIYLDFTQLGFHAMIIGGGTPVFIDPLFSNDNEYYISYFKKDFIKDEVNTWQCELHEKSGDLKDKSFEEEFEKNKSRVLKAALVTKEYQTAIAVTAQYTAIFGGTVADGLAAVVTALNRVTGVYESELGVSLSLVPNNDLIIFTDPVTQPFNNNSGDLNLVQGVIDGAIGSANYDIGHVFTSSNGGIAGLGVVCSTFKARGLTGLPNPMGDPFYIDYVAHEMGHQFDANHTFNGNSGSCSGGNRNPSTAYEPGSGATIMAYAGICGNDNLQNNSDAYFHLISLMEMTNHVNGSAASCATNIDVGNNMPSADANIEGVDGKVIPASTSFELIGEGSDGDGDNLTYQWDEWDLGPQNDVNDPDNGSSPLFRSWFANSSKKRVFPRLEDILNNSTTVGEQLPTTDRSMTFQFIVRDNQGGWMNDAITLDVASAAGPFVITSQNANELVSGSIDITWNVAGTDANGINCANVDILLSTNGGSKFPIILADDTANDGMENITLPDKFSNAARIKVKCSDNVFFDINDANLDLVPENVPCNTVAEITDNPVVDGLYSSASTLLSSGRIPSGGDVIFTANISHEYNPDFTVESGSQWEARIYPCTE